MDRLEPTIPSNPKRLEAYISALDNQHFLTYTKLNHGFWDYLSKLDRLHGLSPKIEDTKLAASIDKHKLSGRRFFVETGFVYEMVELFQIIDHYDADFHFRISQAAFPYSDTLVLDLGRENRTRQVMETYVPHRFLNSDEDGLAFKTACISGDIVPFLRALHPYRVVIIGPDWVSQLGPFLKLTNYIYYPIHNRDARKDRVQHLDWLESDLVNPDYEPTVYLVQAGSLAFWLAAKAYPKLKGKAFFFDLGQTLNLSSVPQLLKQIWSDIYLRQLYRTIQQIHPDWLDQNKAYCSPIQPDMKSIMHSDIITGRRITKPTRELFPDLPMPFNPKRFRSGKTAFIENKLPDYKRVRTFLSLSEKENHWANGGPLCRLLEQSLEEWLQLHPDRTVVLCTNGTAAIHAMMGLEHVKAGRPLRWVVSAYSFFSTYTGPLSNAIIVDCDEQGLLNLAQVEKLPSESYDGLLLTNIFGLYSDFSAYESFCLQRGKRLIIDNASGLMAIHGNIADFPPESLSLHHTKPWGFGEGGCVIINRADEEIVRGLINYGVGLPDSARAYAFNGKIADPACAYILDRLERKFAWERHYSLQYWRLSHILEQLNCSFGFRYRGGRSLSAHFPLLLDHPIPMSDLENPDITLHKYYNPAPGHYPIAKSFYDRIVNIPTHPDMALLSDQQIYDCLSIVFSRSLIDLV